MSRPLCIEGHGRFGIATGVKRSRQGFEDGLEPRRHDLLANPRVFDDVFKHGRSFPHQEGGLASIVMCRNLGREGRMLRGSSRLRTKQFA